MRLRNIGTMITILLVLTTACKNDKKKDAAMPVDNTHRSLEKETSIIRGEFIYLEDIAVFTTNSAIYEVIQDTNMKKLLAATQKLKKNETDMVQATLKVKIIQNPKRQKSNDVWEKAIEIKEIMEVQPATSSPTTTIQ